MADFEKEAFIRLKLDEDEIINKLAKLEKQQIENRTAQRELNNEIKESQKAGKPIDGLVKDLTKLKTEQRQTRQEQSNLNRELKNTKQAGASIKELSKNLDNFRISAKDSYNEAIAKNNLLRKKINETGGAFGENTAELKQLRSALAANNKQIIDFGKSVNDGRPNVGRYKEDIGELAGNFGLVPPQVQAVTRSLKLFKLTLASTGIGLIVIALGTLVGAFLSTQRGADELNKVLRPLKAVFDGLWGAIQDLAVEGFDALSKAIDDPKKAFKELGKLIVDNVINRFKALKLFGDSLVELFKGNFRESATIAGDAIIQFSTGIENGTKKIKGFSDELGKLVDDSVETGKKIDALTKAIEEEEIAFTTLSAKLRQQAKEQNDLAENTELTAAQRVESARKQIEIIEQLNEAEQSLNDKKVELAKLEASLNDTSREEALEIAKIEAQAYLDREAIIERYTTARNKLNIVLNQLSKEERTRIEKELNNEFTKFETLKALNDADLEERLKKSKQIQEISESEISVLEKQVAEEKKLQLSRQEEIKGYVESVTSVFQNHFSNIFDIQKNSNLQRLEQERETLKASVEANKTAFAATSAAEGRLLEIEGEIQAERAENRKEFLKGLLKDTLIAIVSIIQSEITKIIAQSMSTGESVASYGIIGAARAAALTAVVGAAAAAGKSAISSGISKLEDGGVINGKSGPVQIKGKRHSQGGIKFHSPDGYNVEMEDGEVLTVVNRRDAPKLKLLSDINSIDGKPFYGNINPSMMRDGGVQIPTFRRPDTQQAVQVNFSFEEFEERRSDYVNKVLDGQF